VLPPLSPIRADDDDDDDARRRTIKCGTWQVCCVCLEAMKLLLEAKACTTKTIMWKMTLAKYFTGSRGLSRNYKLFSKACHCSREGKKKKLLSVVCPFSALKNS